MHITQMFPHPYFTARNVSHDIEWVMLKYSCFLSIPSKRVDQGTQGDIGYINTVEPSDNGPAGNGTPPITEAILDSFE